MKYDDKSEYVIIWGLAALALWAAGISVWVFFGKKIPSANSVSTFTACKE